MNRKKRRLILSGFTVFLLLMLVLAVGAFFTFKTIVVQGESMEPTFIEGEKVLVSKAYWLVGGVERNDIVVVQDLETGDMLIKRVYALGGESVDVLNAPENWSIRQGEFTVPDGQVYLLGDNYGASQDSRHFGPVDADTIVGKVVILNPNQAERALARTR